MVMKGFNKHVDKELAEYAKTGKPISVKKPKRLASYPRPPTPYGRDDIIEWVRRYDVRSQITYLMVYEEGRKSARLYNPSMRQIRRVFGTFSKLMTEVFGKSYNPNAALANLPPCNAEYMIDIIVSFNVERLSDYSELFKKFPEVFPSWRRVLKVFGGFRQLKYLSRMSSARTMLLAYMKMKKKLHRWPTRGECTKDKIDLSMFVKIHGSKGNFDAFMDGLEEKNEKRK